MKPQATNQELLLFACTGFFSRSFTIINHDKEQSIFCFNIQNLEKACWAGILNDIFPELVEPAFPDQKIYLWQTTPGVQFLKVNIGAHPRPVENETSIDPYFFLSATNNN